MNLRIWWVLPLLVACASVPVLSEKAAEVKIGNPEQVATLVPECEDLGKVEIVSDASSRESLIIELKNKAVFQGANIVVSKLRPSTSRKGMWEWHGSSSENHILQGRAYKCPARIYQQILPFEDF